MNATISTIVDVLRLRAAEEPERLAFSFLTDGEEQGPQWTYGDLHTRAAATARALTDMANGGDRALLVYGPGLEFISAFFGCLYAGVVPVPVYPPRFDRLIQSWESLRNVIRNCEPAVLLTTRDLLSFLPDSAVTGATIRVVCTEEISSANASQWRAKPIDADSLALIQYTSGSTENPRGVMVTHRNLLHNQRVMQAHTGPEGPGTGVCWVPLYHDLGLMGGVMQPLYCGTPCIMMSPLAFLQKPVRWLRAISRQGAQVSGAPNFGYQLCVDRVSPEEKKGLDLSRWDLALVGGEPIQARTLRQFADAFAPNGFRAEVISCGYGLAEATLTVTVAPRFQPVSERTMNACRFVSCGVPWLDVKVVIVDPETRMQCADGVVGEIWVGGPSVAKGYWGRPEETEQVFGARLRDGADGPFLRTGDLGFMQNSELFVTGRIKDILIFHGKNHNPDEIEKTVQAADDRLRSNCGAAFELNRDGEPRLIVVQEVRRGQRNLDFERLLGDVRKAVSLEHGLHVHDLQLLEHGSIPKTSSGKIQRHRCRLGYEQGTLKCWRKAEEKP